MTSDTGYNPLRWNCLEQGCFNYKQRPKIEIFCSAFPGKINFSDVDGFVEIQGNALFLEWKSEPMTIPKGQRIAYERLSHNHGFLILMLAGDARQTRVTHRARFWTGQYHDWQPSQTKDALQYMHRWATWAKANPSPLVMPLRLIQGAS